MRGLIRKISACGASYDTISEENQLLLCVLSFVYSGENLLIGYSFSWAHKFISQLGPSAKKAGPDA